MPFKKYYLCLLNIVLLLLITTLHSQSVSSSPPSDGGATNQSGTECCDRAYGFMPCSNSPVGNLALIIGYGYLFFLASMYLSNGCEILLEILGPGIVGALLLPQLAELADAILMLVSGLTGNSTTAQRQVFVGMGLLVGSTVALLTVVWGSCIVVGKCDIGEEDSLAIDGKDTKGFNLTGTGVTVDIWTCYSAMIMTSSIVPFIVIQLSQFSHSTSGRHIAVLMAFVISLLMLISYSLYQVSQPWIQRRQLAYAKYKHVISGILKHLRERSLGRLLTDDGQPNMVMLQKLFYCIDENKDGAISANELKALVIGIQFEEIDLDKDDVVDQIMKDFDTSRDFRIDIAEFVNGISKWIEKAKQSEAAATVPGCRDMFLRKFYVQTRRKHALLGAQEHEETTVHQHDEDVEEVESPRWNTIKAIAMLLLGAIIAAFFADPLVIAVDNFSSKTKIPSFFISFIALPLATNSGDAMSAIMFARRKKMRTASLTFSEIYGKITVKILLCLSVFFALIYFRALKWEFSAEVAIILIVCIMMGGFASFRTTFPLWTSAMACLFYPFSIGLFCVFEYVFGWS